MAADIQHFAATIPAGTLADAPAVIPVTIPVRVVRRIDWTVPPGNMGTMSFLLAMSKVPVLPVSGQQVYVSADGVSGTWHLDDYPDSGAWQVVGTNVGVYPHSVMLTFHCDFPVRPKGLAKNISPYDIMPSPDLSQAGPPVRLR